MNENLEAALADLDSASTLRAGINLANVLLVTGSALSRESLLRAGISDAEILVLATNDDETNLLGCAFAKKVYSEQVGDRGASGLTTIAQIRDPNLLEPSRGAGPLESWSKADHVVCSADEIVEQLAAGLLAPSIDEILRVLSKELALNG